MYETKFYSVWQFLDDFCDTSVFLVLGRYCFIALKIMFINMILWMTESRSVKLLV